MSIISSVKEVVASGYFIVGFIMLLLAIVTGLLLVTADDIKRLANVSVVRIRMLKASV